MQTPITTTPKFIKLENLQLIKIEFECSADSRKEELRIDCISNRLLRLNLMMVDSKFPEIIAEAAVSANKMGECTLEQIIEGMILRSQFTKQYAALYYQYKINNFLQLLLYSNLASNSVCNGEIDSTRVYVYRNKEGELNYFSIYDQRALYELIQKKCRCRSSTVVESGGVKKVIFQMQMPSQL